MGTLHAYKSSRLWSPPLPTYVHVSTLRERRGGGGEGDGALATGKHRETNNSLALLFLWYKMYALNRMVRRHDADVSCSCAWWLPINTRKLFHNYGTVLTLPTYCLSNAHINTHIAIYMMYRHIKHMYLCVTSHLSPSFKYQSSTCSTAALSLFSIFLLLSPQIHNPHAHLQYVVLVL